MITLVINDNPMKSSFKLIYNNPGDDLQPETIELDNEPRFMSGGGGFKSIVDFVNTLLNEEQELAVWRFWSDSIFVIEANALDLSDSNTIQAMQRISTTIGDDAAKLISTLCIVPKLEEYYDYFLAYTDNHFRENAYLVRELRDLLVTIALHKFFMPIWRAMFMFNTYGKETLLTINHHKACRVAMMKLVHKITEGKTENALMTLRDDVMRNVEKHGTYSFLDFQKAINDRFKSFDEFISISHFENMFTIFSLSHVDAYGSSSKLEPTTSRGFVSYHQLESFSHRFFTFYDGFMASTINHPSL